MAIAPRNSKEFIRLLESDPSVKAKLYAMVREADKTIQKRQVEILRNFLRENGVDPRQLKGTIFDAVVDYYKKIKLNGDWIKMY